MPEGPEEPKEQAQEEMQGKHAGTGHRAEKNSMVDQGTQSAAMGGHCQKLRPHLSAPSRTTQIDAPRPPVAGVSGTSTMTPQKMVGSVVNQATSHAGVGPGGTGPLDLSNCTKRMRLAGREMRSSRLRWRTS